MSEGLRLCVVDRVGENLEFDTEGVRLLVLGSDRLAVKDRDSEGVDVFDTEADR